MRLVLSYITAICVLIISHPAFATMTIDQAYERSRVERLTYDVASAQARDAVYLAQLFTVTDEVVRLRATLFVSMNEGAFVDRERYNEAYQNILSDLMCRLSPEGAREAHGLIVSAILDQKRFLNEWLDRDAPPLDYVVLFREQLILDAHVKLSKAYESLTWAYWWESRRNKRAIQAHLAAMDMV